MSLPYAVSVVIPVHNGESTIASTIRSLQAQSYRHWEAVVVDDGSTDETASIVEDIDDDRVRLIRQDNRGVSAARNTGTRAARYPWLLYLDGDDSIAPSYFDHVVAALRSRPKARFATTGWIRLSVDGRLYDEVGARYFDDLFETAATHCPFCIHSCVVNRDLVLDVQGWDESLNNCEDWDLWARIARTGADYVVASDALAIYRTRPTSACFDGQKMLEDGITVLSRTHQADFRVPNALAKYLPGRDRQELDTTIFGLAAWCAGQVLGIGRDATGLLDTIADRRAPLVDPQTVAHCLDVAGGIGSMGLPLHERWNDHYKLYSAFLERMEEISGCPRLAARTELELARRASEPAATSRSLDLGRVWSVVVDCHEPLSRIEVPSGVERVLLRVTAEGLQIGHAEVPVIDGAVEPERLHNAVVDQLAAEIFGHHASAIVRGKPENATRPRTIVQQLESAIWGDVRNPTPVAPIRVIGSHHLELAIAAGDLITDPRSFVDVSTSLAGRPTGTFRLSTRSGRIKLSRIRATVLRHARMELIRAVVSAGLIGRPAVDIDSLRERLRDASGTPARSARTVRHLNVPLSSSWLVRFADNRPTSAAWARNTAGRLTPRHRRLAKKVYLRAQSVPLPGQRGRIPILMYHRVSPEGSRSTDRWRVSPDQLDAHLDALQRAGYTAISVEQLRQVMFEGARPPRRPVVLSFDDGYMDFAEHAWPRLRARGCGATVFVVAGEAGGTNQWDDVFDHSVPLMDWPTLRRLAAEGADIGSHSYDHRMLTSLPQSEVVAQAVSSKQTIEENTGLIVRSFAYPYGDADAVVADAVESAGYQLAVTCDHGPVTIRSEPMMLPRVEVTQAMSAADLLGRLARLRG